MNNKLLINSILAIVAALFLSACGNGGGGAADTVPSVSNGSVVTAMSLILPGDTDCPTGGITVDSGIDENANGILDSGEVDTTQKVCNGAAGTVAIIAITNDSDGICTYGGKKIESGLDLNGNNVLDGAEAGTPSYVCNGSAGTNGTDGIDGSDGVAGSNGFNSLVKVSDEAPGSNCTNGGKKIESGLDTSNFGVLDPAEAGTPTYICNGIDGTDGSDGAAGSDGLISLVMISNEPAGSNCTDGGKKVEAGLDNIITNGVLDPAEAGTPSYICNGIDGTDGTNGAPGADGLTTLIKISDEPAGPNCTYGGKKIESGLDNIITNGVLDPAEAGTPQYICNGSTGEVPVSSLSNIVGSVILENGRAAYGAMVFIPGTSQYAFTDIMGKYTIEGLDAGQMDIAISYSGYSMEFLNVSVPKSNVAYAREVTLYYERTSFDRSESLWDFPTFEGIASTDSSGYAVSTAGDVNGDGYDDILIGAYGVNSSAGETYLIYGKPGMDMDWSLMSSPDVTFTGKAANDYSGCSVSTAGDVNNDGYDDILIGALGANGFIGETYLIYGTPDLSGTVGLASADVLFNGIAASDYSGSAVSTAGDVNGDGYDDMLIGAYGVSGGIGETYLIYGSSALAATIELSSANVSFNGITDDNSGFAVSTAGDVNGDGYDDILIGAFLASPGGISNAGEAYLIYGSSTLPATVGLASADVIFNGISTLDRSGNSVSTAGDVNGDGYADILIGANGANSYAGETYLIYGSSTLSGTIGLASANATFTGKAAGDNSGYSVSTAGDVNGDGYDDILIGAYGANSSTGETYLIYGSSTLGDTALSAADATLTGMAATDQSGYSVSTAGDVNGDGYADIIIGAYGANSSAGETYLIHGRPLQFTTEVNELSGTLPIASADATYMGKTASNRSGFSVSDAGDVNGDGYADILIGADGANSSAGETYLIYGRRGMDFGRSLLASPDVTFTGTAANDYSGYTVSSAGDVNADGYDDILIGAYGANSSKGETYLIYGNSTLTDTIDLASADVIFNGIAASDESGKSVSGAGDVNGDGYDDILIGASGAIGSAGQTYLVYGSSSLSGTLELASANVIFTGKTGGDNSGISVSTAGDVNGDGYDDILIGALYATAGVGWGAGETYLIYGSQTTLEPMGLALANATFTGKASMNYSGRSVSTAGDVNGDGYDDILIGAYAANSGKGETYLINGSSTLSGTKALASANTTFIGKTASDNSGISVSTAGDVNGDGYDDILIGAYLANPGGNNDAGESYLIYGRSALSSIIGLASADATFTGKKAGDYSGYSVSTAGDFNGDRYADILIGAYWADPVNKNAAGETYLITGMGY